MILNIKQVTPLIVSLLFLTACNKKSGSSDGASQGEQSIFLGEWEELDGRKTVRFEKAGDNIFMISGGDRFKTSPNTKKAIDVDYGSLGVYPAEIDDDGELNISFKSYTRQYVRTQSTTTTARKATSSNDDKMPTKIKLNGAELGGDEVQLRWYQSKPSMNLSHYDGENIWVDGQATNDSTYFFAQDKFYGLELNFDSKTFTESGFDGAPLDDVHGTWKAIK